MTAGKVISIQSAQTAAGSSAFENPSEASFLEQALHELTRFSPETPADISRFCGRIAKALHAEAVTFFVRAPRNDVLLSSLGTFYRDAVEQSFSSIESESGSAIDSLLQELERQLCITIESTTNSSIVRKLHEEGLLQSNTGFVAAHAVLAEGRMQGLLLIEYKSDPGWSLANRLFLSSAAESAGKLLLLPIFSRAHLPLQYRIELKAIIQRLSSGLTLSGEQAFEQSVNEVLRDIGIFLGVERCYINTCSADEQSVRSSFNWTSFGGRHPHRSPRTVPVEEYPWAMSLLKRGEQLVVHNMDRLPPEAAIDAANWKNRGIRSFITIPLCADSKLLGMFGVSLRSRPHWWTEDEIHFLQAIAPLLTDAFLKRQTEARTQKTEARLETMIKESPVAVAMFDRTMQLIMASDRWFVDLGIDPLEAVGKPYYQLMPDIPKRWKQIHREVLAGAVRRSDEDLFILSDGTSEWVRWEARPWHNRQGAIGGLVLFREWITKRKETEERLRIYQFAMDRSADGVFWYLPDGSISYVNDAACRLLGYTKDELLSLSVFEIIPEMSPDAWQQFWHTSRNNPSYSSEVKYRKKDGSLFLIEANENYLEFGGKEFVCCFARDTSERRRHFEERERLAESLHRQQRFLRQVIDLNPNYIFAKDLEGRYTLVNKATADRYDLPVEEILGKTDLELNQPEDESRRFHKEDLEVAQTRKPLFIPNDVVHIKGKKVWLQTEKLPIVDENGEVHQVLGVATDISDRKLAEESRIELEHKIQHTQKLESLGVLAGGIAHDFNNLLMGILGNAGLVLMQLSTSSPTHKRIERIKVAAERAADLTNQLLAYSGKGKFIVEPINLSQLVQEMMALLETVISKKSSIVCDFANGMPYIEADATQIRQVVMNLITNASEALEDQHGVISVTTGVLDADEEYLSTIYLDDKLPPGRYCYLEVHDTGKGMDKQTLGKIFDPFFTTKFAGRGLGLAGVLGIVRSHRGALQVDSALGSGTSFRAIFPAVNGPVAVPQFDDLPLRTKVKSSHGVFLVVDDEELTLAVAEESLQDAGYEVLLARDGQEGIDVFSRHHHRLSGVLLDVTMPIVDGEEALKEMQQINSHVPIFLSSGFSEQEATRRVHSGQVASFIQKPYLPETLINKINEVLGTSQTEEDA